MRNKKSHGLNKVSLDKKKAQDTKYPHGVQQRIIFNSFADGAKTMLQVQKLTGVKRSTICGYVGRFRKKGLIRAVYKDACTVSGNKAFYFKIM